MPETALKRRESNPASVWSWTVNNVLLSPILWGSGATVAFYGGIPHLASYREFAQRYFCSHPIEYAEVGMFLIGMAILTGRFLRLLSERRALRSDVLDTLTQGPASSGDLTRRLDAIDAALDALPPRRQQSVLVTRWRDVCEFVRTRHAARGLEEHLKFLSERAVDRLYDSYSLLLTINWAVPILGFLGTVVGITLAIANVTPEQLDTSLNNVTGGLAVAFDTTSVAMSFSLVLVFSYDLIKRCEQHLLAQVEQISLQQWLPLFLDDDSQADPMHAAQTAAARQLLDRTESLIIDQTSLWRDSMEGLRERWSETLDTQQQELTSQLHRGVEITLSEHAAQLRNVRESFLIAFEKAATQFDEALKFDAARRDQQDAQSQVKQEQMWKRIHAELEEVVRAHDARNEDLLDSLSERMTQWQSALSHSSEAVAAQLDTLTEYTRQLNKLAQQQEQLAQVERQLSDNLEAVRAAETFEQTLHNLTAAVHLLTARAKPRAA
jgi:biopolymer transport protein ExbB/TolQ